MHPGLAAAVSLGAALVAWWARAVSRDGAWAGALVASVVLTCTGWAGGGILAAFVIPSTLVGRLTPPRTTTAAPEEIRSAIQVLSNGGPAAAGSLAELAIPGLGLWILAASLAAVSADTWATAFGRWTSRDPRLLGFGRRVPPGTSGGVSLTGTLGATAGAAAVASVATVSVPDPGLFAATFGIGLGGMFLDSTLGALAQARFVCPACGNPSEHPRHCGGPARLVKGWRWLDNDAVNAVTGAAAALAGAGAFLLR